MADQVVSKDIAVNAAKGTPQNQTSTISTKSSSAPTKNTPSSDSFHLISPIKDLKGIRYGYCSFSEVVLKLFSNEWTDLVMVVVSKDEQPFFVHRYILNQIPFFEACLRSGCKESETGVIELKMGPPSAFGHVLKFVTSGKLVIDKRPNYESNNLEAGDYEGEVIDVYVMSSFLMLESLSNAAIDAFYQHAFHGRKWVSGPFVARRLHSESLQDSRLLDMVMIRRAQLMRQINIIGTPSGDQFMNGDARLGVDRFEKVLAAVLDPRSDPKVKNEVCQWHIHNTTPVCGKPT